MKHWKKIITSLLLGTGFIGAGELILDRTAVIDISPAKVMEEYSLAPQISAKYQLDDVVLKRVVKDNPKDKIEVTIGDNIPVVKEGFFGASESVEFKPKLKIARWDDEVNLTLLPKELAKVEAKDKALKFQDDKIKLETPKIDYHLYEMPVDSDNPEGAYEYEVILKEKPASNVVEFALGTKGLDFFYQPELTEEEKAEGAERPENVIGSYAVYTSEQKTNYVGGKEYKAGKVGHIYRPKIVDADGVEVWGQLRIDIENGILSVEIPQDFLDKASYPVIVDPTFGYDSAGSSYNTSEYGRALYAQAGGDGTITSVSYYVNIASGTYTSGAAIYSGSDSNLSGNTLLQAGNNNVTVDTTAAWYSDTLSLGITNGTYYFLAHWGNAARRQYYDSTTRIAYYLTRSASNFPNWLTTADAISTANDPSIYATYTASGGGGTTTTPIYSKPLFFD